MTKGIWIPTEVLHDKNLTFLEKFMLMEILQLSMLDKGCIASNEHFALLLQISKPNASRTLHSLEKKGYVKVEIESGSRNQKRVIKMIFGGYQNDNAGYQNDNSLKGIKTVNKTSNIKNTKKALDFRQIENELVEKYKDDKSEMGNHLNYLVYMEFVEHRRGKKNPVTRAGALKQIKLLCRYPNNIQAEMVDKSIVGGYQGLFEIKTPTSSNTTSSNVTKDTIDRTFKRGKYATGGKTDTIDTEVIDG